MDAADVDLYPQLPHTYTVSGFVLGYGYPVGMKSPVRDVNGENLSPRAGTGTRTGYISVRGDENVLTISVGDVPGIGCESESNMDHERCIAL